MHGGVHAGTSVVLPAGEIFQDPCFASVCAMAKCAFCWRNILTLWNPVAVQVDVPGRRITLSMYIPCKGMGLFPQMGIEAWSSVDQN